MLELSPSPAEQPHIDRELLSLSTCSLPITNVSQQLYEVACLTYYAPFHFRRGW